MTEDQVKLIHRMMHMTWDQIGYEILQEVDHDMPKDEVIEVILDADHMRFHGLPGFSNKDERTKAKEALGIFEKMPMDEQNRIAMEFSQAKRFSL